MGEALEQLREDLTAVDFVPGTEAEASFRATLARARRLLEVKLLLEARRPGDAPPLVVIAGGTNVGKSTVFNWVVGDTVASSSPLARHTKAPTVFVHQDQSASLCDGALLPGYRRLALSAPTDAAAETGEGQAYFLRTHQQEPVRAVVLVDSPDIDSTHARNRQVAEDLLFLADALVFVATPEKYNDELCVRYLRDAVALEKGLICVLNKGADPDVERDFREVVVPGLGKGITVVAVPYVTPRPDPRQDTPHRAALLAAVVQPAERSRPLREGARRGACVSLGQDLERLVSRLREERSELDRVRAEMDLALQARRDDYARFLNGVEFYELDRVFERVLRYFRIPVLDSVYEGVQGAIGFVTGGLARLVSGGPREDSRTAKLRARADEDRQKVKELIETARAELLEAPRRHTGALHEAAPAWLSGLEAGSIEQVNSCVESFLTRGEAEAERWIERETQRHVELLEQHPYARNTLRALKGFFQVGFGLLSAKLTGGFGPWDVLIGGATERATKIILESVGGYVHYQTLKAEFTGARAALFFDTLEQAVGAPLRARLPQGIDPERLERLDQAAHALKRGRLPS